MFMDNPWERSMFFLLDADGAAGGGGDAGGGDAGKSGDTGGTAAGIADPPPAELTMDQVRAAFAEDVRGEKMFDNIKTVADLGKSFVHAQKQIGKSTDIPGENATPEEKSQFWQRLGAPQHPEGYGLKPESFEGIDSVDPEYLSALAAKAHSIGLTQDQMAALVDFQTEQIINTQEKMFGDQADVLAELKQTWGGGTDRNVALAKEAVFKLGGEEARNLMNETGIGNLPLIIKMMAKVGHIMAERGLITEDETGVPTQDKAHEEGNRIIFSKEHPLHDAYHDSQHPDHKKAVERVQKLYEAKFSTPLEGM